MVQDWEGIDAIPIEASKKKQLCMSTYGWKYRSKAVTQYVLVGRDQHESSDNAIYSRTGVIGYMGKQCNSLYESPINLGNQELGDVCY